MVAALFVVTFGMANPLAAFGVFLPVLADAFGWSRGAIAVALSINLLLGGLVAFAIGGLADRHGPRAILAVTVVLTGLGFGLVAAVQALWQLYLAVGLLAGLGTSSFYVLAAATVSRWFVRRRGLALGIVLTGFNLGFMTGGPAAAFLIERAGWRAAYALLAGGLSAAGLLASLLVRVPAAPTAGARARPEPAAASPAGPTFREALGQGRLWMLAASWLLAGGVLMMVSVHVVPFALDRGLALDTAALALTAYGLGAVSGRVVFGAAADRVGARPAMWACASLQVAALGGLTLGRAPGALLGLMAAFGFGFAGADTVFVKAVPDVFGLRALGAIMGVLGLGWRCGAALGPAIAGFISDATGSYALPFGAAPAAIAASLALYLGGAGRRRSDRDQVSGPRRR